MNTSGLSSTKRALLIGNNNYKVGNKLDCCEYDVEDVGKELEKIGFHVTIRVDQTYRDMVSLITRFQNQICEGDLVVFFFSGHGVQWNNENYLVPIDNESFADNPNMYEYYAVSVQKTLESIKESQPHAIVFLLDCCRRIPKENRKLGGRSKATIPKSDSTDCMSIKGVQGSLIAFACGPDEETFDRSPNNRNSIFTYHLLQYIAEPDLKIEEMMCRVSDGIYNANDEKIYAYRLSTLRTSEIYFNTTAKGTIFLENRKKSIYS
jgi:uncharacterized caspase-like protein